MKKINIGSNIKIYWKIWRGANKVTEDFNSMNTNLKVFLVGSGDTYYLEPSINNAIDPGYDVIELDIPAFRLDVGVYNIKAIWEKNGGRNVLTSSRAAVLYLTDSPSEAPIQDEEVRIVSLVESFGRDGMSAYEAAIMRGIGIGTLSEKEWITQFSQHVVDEVAEAERKDNEDIRIKNENDRIASESKRNSEEINRVSAEEERKRNEVLRKNSVPKLRFENNSLQVTYDKGGTWETLSDPFDTNLNIEGYVDTKSNLPSDAAIGAIYGVKHSEYTEDNPKYIIYVYSSGGWVNNGVFGSLKAGIVQTTGTSEDVVMSQKATTDAIEDNRHSDVMLRSVRSHGGELAKLSDSLLDVRLDGMPDNRKLIVSKFSLVSYEGYYLSIRIADITDGTVNTVASFSSRNAEMNGVATMNLSTIDSKEVYAGTVTVDLGKIGVKLFSGFDVNEFSEDLYDKYGIKPNAYRGIPASAAIGGNIPGRVKAAFERIGVANLDDTRKYILKQFVYDQSSSLLTISLCTDENAYTAYLIQVTENRSGKVRIYNADKTIFADVDMDILKSKFCYNFTNATLDYDGYGVKVDTFSHDVVLHAEEELSLTLGGIPLKLLDCGKLSSYFYLGWKNTIFKAESIVKEHYSASDIGRDLIPVCSFDSIAQISSKKFIEGINSVRELNSGDLLINVNVNSYSTTEKTEFASYSVFYRYDGSDLHHLFDGSWGYKTLTSGTVQTGGFMTNVWDFDQHDDLVFVSERGTQGQQGRVWMSKDGGVTWYVIFNAFTHTNYDLYKIVQPSGWDNTNTSKPDFQRPIPNTPTYPNSSFFHIHGVSYDKWRDQVIVVSGDATWAKGSYSAIWVLRNPRSCEVYPASGDIPEGGTSSDKAPKMLKCDWKRVGLYNDENSIGKNLQFVMSLPFKDVISFGTDCGGGGINGVINNTYPANIVGSNLKVAYALNPDNENLLTHCASGALRLKNAPVLWVHHREGTGFTDSRISNQMAAILSSYDGKMWKRVWEDDTLDVDMNSKVSWGATLIGKKDELYLRYKGFATTDNVIRRLVINL